MKKYRARCQSASTSDLLENIFDCPDDSSALAHAKDWVVLVNKTEDSRFVLISLVEIIKPAVAEEVRPVYEGRVK